MHHNKTTNYRFIFIGISVAIIVSLFIYLWPLEPNVIAQKAQALLTQASSYQFELVVVVALDGQDQKIAFIDGKFSRPDNYYLKGSIYDYKLELYHIGKGRVFLDPADGQWKRISSAPSLVKEAISFTTSPIADFLAAEEFQLISRQKIGTGSLMNLGTKLDSTNNPYWPIFFDDFYLQAWIKYPDFRLERLQLSGSSQHSSEDYLQASLALSDYGMPVQIERPDIVDE